MIDQNDHLPEGTDSIVAGASDIALNQEHSTVTQPTKRGQLVDKVKTSSGKLADQAADKTRGLVGQGLERSSEALASVSKMVGDTAAGIDERLGTEYGDYARKAADAIDGAANSLASKTPDELIDDTRDFVKRSPGIALAGAAVVGFVLARLVKTGLDSDKPKA
ncbi:hypothetical protein [Sphingomonas sp.]|uniref:hypothetical protein n=1 Tax=Sphingomonas sp. TaxID=28214 RepID=UPI00286BFAAB|nr:hypothetical protein [Sphingomonas sp.]